MKTFGTLGFVSCALVVAGLGCTPTMDVEDQFMSETPGGDSGIRPEGPGATFATFASGAPIRPPRTASA